LDEAFERTGTEIITERGIDDVVTAVVGEFDIDSIYIRKIKDCQFIIGKMQNLAPFFLEKCKIWGTIVLEKCKKMERRFSYALS